MAMAQMEMQELHKIAKLHYETSTAEVQIRAMEFFDSMDADGDGQVNIIELLSFMSEQGSSELCNPKLFNLLDTDGSGALSFEEAKTLFYIIISGRPFCSRLIAGIFFACPLCSFHVCPTCFRDARLRKHLHDGRPVQLLDSFVFLQVLRSQNNQPPSPPPPQVQSMNSGYDASRALVARQRTKKREVAYKALMLALATTGPVLGIPTIEIAQTCTIL